MQVTLAGLADFASTSADGKLNVLGLFDEITPDSDFPYRWPRLYLVVSFALSPDEVMAAHPIQVILRDWEDNAVLTVTKHLVAGSPDGSRQRLAVHKIIEVCDVCFQDAGCYRFSILSGDEEFGSAPLRVNEPILN